MSKCAQIYIYIYAPALFQIDVEACTQTMILSCLCVHNGTSLYAAGRRATLRLGRVDRRVTPDVQKQVKLVSNEGSSDNVVRQICLVPCCDHISSFSVHCALSTKLWILTLPKFEHGVNSNIMKKGYESKPHESLTQLQCNMTQHDVTAETAQYWTVFITMFHFHTDKTCIWNLTPMYTILKWQQPNIHLL